MPPSAAETSRETIPGLVGFPLARRGTAEIRQEGDKEGGKLSSRSVSADGCLLTGHEYTLPPKLEYLPQRQSSQGIDIFSHTEARS